MSGPGHADVPGNVEADEIAGMTASWISVGSEPIVSLPESKIRSIITTQRQADLQSFRKNS